MFSTELKRAANAKIAEEAIRDLVQSIRRLAMNVARNGGTQMVYPFDLPIEVIEIINKDGLFTTIDNGKLTVSW